jgi:hypothetical protein
MPPLREAQRKFIAAVLHHDGVATLVLEQLGVHFSKEH